MPSIYLSELSSEKKIITVEGEEYHHLINVKRTGIGESVKLNSGAGLMAEGKLIKVNKKSAEIEIDKIDKVPYPERPFAIAFALLKNRRDDWLIEKCTELGVTAFYPMLTDYSVRTPSQNTITRFNLIALAAIKQCDNPWMPKINEPLPLEETVNKIFSEGWIPVLCSERKPDKRITYLPKIIKPCFLIGPEGGFSEDEFTYFSEQNILSISICHLITRAETAAIAVAAQYQAYF